MSAYRSWVARPEPSSLRLVVLVVSSVRQCTAESSSFPVSSITRLQSFYQESRGEHYDWRRVTGLYWLHLISAEARRGRA